MDQDMTLRRGGLYEAGRSALYLSACILNGQTPKRVPGNMDSFYRFCKFHGITSIVAMALEEYWKQNPPADPSVCKPWKQAKEKAIRKNILLNAERDNLIRFLESASCWYMPLKGSLLQFDYPRFGMRQMSDNDILCDPEFAPRIRSYMEENGYTCALFGQGNHDEYIRQPVYNFEIHRALFKAETAPKFAEYYRNIHARSIKDPENHYGFHMSHEDFYIYMILHAYNHFAGGGVGIRNLLDVYVFQKKYGRELDWDYVHRELDGLGALAFENCCSRLSGLFLRDSGAEPVLGAEDEELLYIFFSSGAYGTESRLLETAMQRFRETKNGSKFRFILERMFPSAEMLGIMYPAVKGRKWLVPFVWIYRLIKSLLRSPGRVFRELLGILHFSADK